MNQRLIHDHAFALTTVLYERMAHLTREQRDLFDFYYESSKNALEAFAQRPCCPLEEFAGDIARTLFDATCHLVNDDERPHLMYFYGEAAQAALTSYTESARRMFSRLNPSNN